jgi:DNA polymerase-3 subunit epsilon
VLCERFEIDRSARTLHSALIDTQLLAEVYLALTRGQDSLDIGLGASRGEAKISSPVSRPATLRVIRATETELATHAAVVEGLEKASGGKAVWQKWRTEPTGPT